MSRYSGKCDFGDTVDMIESRNENILDYKIVINKDGVFTPIDFKSKDELLRYYPNLEQSYGNKQIVIGSLPYLYYNTKHYGIRRTYVNYRKELNDDLKKVGQPILYPEETCSNDYLCTTSLFGVLYLDKEYEKNYWVHYFLCHDKENNYYVLCKKYIRKKEEYEYLLIPVDNKDFDIKTLPLLSIKHYLGRYDFKTDTLVLKERKTTKVGKMYIDRSIRRDA